jgi:hypothetical protein
MRNMAVCMRLVIKNWTTKWNFSDQLLHELEGTSFNQSVHKQFSTRIVNYEDLHQKKKEASKKLSSHHCNVNEDSALHAASKTIYRKGVLARARKLACIE